MQEGWASRLLVCYFIVLTSRASTIENPVFPLITAVPAIHGIREGLAALKNEGTDVVTAKKMGPKQFFEVMGE